MVISKIGGMSLFRYEYFLFQKKEKVYFFIMISNWNVNGLDNALKKVED